MGCPGKRQRDENPEFHTHLLHKNALEDKRFTLCLARGVGIICQLILILEVAVPTRNVVLTNHQALFVEQLVGSGRYQNASEVLREGLRLIEQREREQAARLQAFREAVAVGMADMDAGRYTTLESAASLRSHVATLITHVTPSH